MITARSSSFVEGKGGQTFGLWGGGCQGAHLEGIYDNIIDNRENVSDCK